MIYFISAARSQMVKIGKTTNVSNRLCNLRTFSPEPLVLLGLMAGGIEEERALHKRFKPFRKHGEWFDIKGEVAQFLKELPPISEDQYMLEKLVTARVPADLATRLAKATSKKAAPY